MATETVSAARSSLAINACFEIGLLSKEVRRVMANEDDEATLDALTRGMLARIEHLANAAYSCLDLGYDRRTEAALRAAIECTPEPAEVPFVPATLGEMQNDAARELGPRPTLRLIAGSESVHA